jgi:ATP-dependent DNA helicase RecG
LTTTQAPRKSKKEAVSIVAFCAVPRSREEIQTYLGLKDREHFRISILQPLLRNGSLVPTIPDKPNSPRQKYIAARKK